MKKRVVVGIVGAVLGAAICVSAYAHSGGTDSNGGHWDHSTGEYHFHHGEPAHQHTNGICPFEDTQKEPSAWETAKENAGLTNKTYDAYYERGYDAGYANGYDDAYIEAWQEGNEYGYNGGYQDGYAATQSEPKTGTAVVSGIFGAFVGALGAGIAVSRGQNKDKK